MTELCVCVCFIEALTEEEKEKMAKIKKKMKKKVCSPDFTHNVIVLIFGINLFNFYIVLI